MLLQSASSYLQTVHQESSSVCQIVDVSQSPVGVIIDVIAEMGRMKPTAVSIVKKLLVLHKHPWNISLFVNPVTGRSKIEVLFFWCWRRQLLKF